MEMATLWMRMIELYGRRWTHQFGEIPPPGQDHSAMRSWAAGLRDKSSSQLRTGIRKCVESGRPWPPSLPEFHALCQITPADLKLPPPPQAIEQAHRHRAEPARMHPAVAATVAALARDRSPEWHSISQREAAFLRVYRFICKRLINGQSIDEPVPRSVIQPEPIDPPATPEQARIWLQTLRRMVTDGPLPDPLPVTSSIPTGSREGAKHGTE